MNNVYDVQQLLKKFGAFIYVGNRTASLQMMLAEVTELWDHKLIDSKEYASARLVLLGALREEENGGIGLWLKN
ncbi:YqgQ family protein [Brochothrix thermosphacta]|uniref:YqgQ family protein n=1 Tax=Brochothrix thermosphacta TaxID=2756 RepID=UPI001C4EAC84|nr:YqgQ family protein [Brochothrix thermosphacta]